MNAFVLTSTLLTDAGYGSVKLPDVIIRPRVTVMRIKEEVCRYYGIRLADMMSDRRDRFVARARQVVMFLAKEQTFKSYPTIGRELRRDHTTVVHGVSVIAAMEHTDRRLADDLAILRERLAA